jgi:hypothetical protein
MCEGWKVYQKIPKKMIKETQTGNDGYPLYRQQAPEAGGFTATLKIRSNTEIEIDSRWVVPFSLLLSKMFQAHINVEYCNSVKSISMCASMLTKVVIWLSSP